MVGMVVCVCFTDLKKTWTPTTDGTRKMGVWLQVWVKHTHIQYAHTRYMSSSSPKCLPCEEGPRYRGCNTKPSLTEPKAKYTRESNLDPPHAAGLGQDPDTQRISSAH